MECICAKLLIAIVIWTFAPARQPWQKPAHRHWRRRRAAARGRSRRPWRPMSARRRPERAGGRRRQPCLLRRHAERALHVGGPLGSRQPDLLRRRLDALERAGGTGTPLARRDCGGQHGRLVEAPRPQAAASAAAPAPARRPRPAFRGRHALIQRPIIGARSSRSPYLRACTSAREISSKRTAARARLIGRRIGDRFHRQHARARVIDERNAEPLAIRRVMKESFDQHAGQSRLAFDRLAAGGAERRQREIERRAQHARALRRRRV